jgi:hypothetical protein
MFGGNLVSIRADFPVFLEGHDLHGTSNTPTDSEKPDADTSVYVALE